MSCCASETTDSDDDYMSCCDFEEFCQEDHDTSGYMEWKYHEGRTGSGQSDRKCRRDWTFVDPCFRMMRGFPQVEDLTQDEIDDSDGPQAGKVSEVGSPSLANSEDLEGWGPMNLVCQNAQIHQMVQRDQIWSAVSLNWVMDVSDWDMGRTPARRVGHKHETPHSLAADFLFVAGKHWKFWSC